jgi:hypothetical protein
LDLFRALYFHKTYSPTPAAMAKRPHGIPAAKPIFALLLSLLEDLDGDPNVEGDADGEEVGLDGNGDNDRVDDRSTDSKV